MNADQILASKSIAELEAVLKRGLERLALVDSLQEMDVREEFDGPFPPTKAFETWAARHHDNETRLLLLGMADVRREIALRAAKVGGVERLDPAPDDYGKPIRDASGRVVAYLDEAGNTGWVIP